MGKSRKKNEVLEVVRGHVNRAYNELVCSNKELHYLWPSLKDKLLEARQEVDRLYDLFELPPNTEVKGQTLILKCPDLGSSVSLYIDIEGEPVLVEWGGGLSRGMTRAHARLLSDGLDAVARGEFEEWIARAVNPEADQRFEDFTP